MRSPIAVGTLALGLTACRIAADEGPRTVVVLVLDGVRLEESLGDDPSSATGEDPQAFMPEVWDELLPEGLRSTDAWNLGATTTTPAHVAMLTGRRLPLANYATEHGPGVYRPGLPLLAELLEEAQPDSQSSVLANTTLLWPLQRSLWPGTETLGGTEWVFVPESGSDPAPATKDFTVIAALEGRLEARPTRFAVANLHQVDRDGHFGDHDDYLDSVRSLDGPIAGLWQWLQRQDGYRDHTWLLVLADHGRHTAADTEPPWRHHGCSCNGCRRVPFLLLGPGVRAGQDADGPILLTDLAPTLAALLGVEMPWADGLVRDDWFDQPTGGTSRSGLADFAVAQGLVAEVDYGDDPAHRSALWVEGLRLSDPDAIAVEAPSLARDGDRAWLCWREITLAPEEAETAWRPRCAASRDAGLSWTPFDAPASDVGAFWRARLAVSPAGDLIAAYGLNPNGLATEGSPTAEVSVDLARLDGEIWSIASATGALTFPTGGSLVLGDGVAYVAVAASDTGNEARYSRGIYAGRATFGAGAPTWSPLIASQFTTLAPEGAYWRVEHPALHLGSDGVLELAASGFHEGGSVAILARGFSDLGWNQVQALDLPARLEPEVEPVWIEDLAVFATYDPARDAAGLCAGSFDQTAVCLDSGAARIARLSADGDTLYALVGLDGGVWELRTWGVEEFGT